MTMMRIDATGKPCPQPVMLAKKAVDGGAEALEVTVDNPVSASNVTRFLESQGYSVTPSGEVPRLVLEARKTGEAGPEPALTCPSSPSTGDYGVLLLSRTLGGESPELGEALMKAFLGTLAQRTPLPSVLALMNGAVFLALKDSSAHETLAEMATKGVQVLVCGTCTKHFDVTDRVAVGTISNMFEITEAVYGTAKPVVMG